MHSSDALCDEVLITLKRISRAIDIHSRRLMQTTGLTGPQLLILQVLERRAEAIPIGELAGSISLSQGTVTSIVERLLKKGLIEKTRSTQDKRKMYISLTEAGRQSFNNAPTALQEHFIGSFQKLQDWEQTLLLSSLQRVAHMMNARDLEIEPMLDIAPLTEDVIAQDAINLG